MAEKLLVVIDPGHTGRKYNAGAVKGYYESSAVYDLSVFEKEALEKRGIDVLLTRTLNQNPALYERGQMAVKKGKGYEHVLFESNHSNAFSDSSACGVTVFRSAHLPDSEKLGIRLADAITGVMAPATDVTYNRGISVKTQSNGADWYGVIRGAVSGAVSSAQAAEGPVQYAYIVEHGFHTNRAECAFLNESENLRAIADAKAKAIAAYFGIETGGSPAPQVPYLVRVSVNSLNIREKPTVFSSSKGYTGVGVFTITEEALGESDSKGTISRWGRLKSGLGWICLDYTEKAA